MEFASRNCSEGIEIREMESSRKCPEAVEMDVKSFGELLLDTYFSFLL